MESRLTHILWFLEDITHMTFPITAPAHPHATGVAVFLAWLLWHNACYAQCAKMIWDGKAVPRLAWKQSSPQPNEIILDPDENGAELQMVDFQRIIFKV